MKIAPILMAMEKYNSSLDSRVFESVLVHSGQHYDYEMSKVFFEDLKLPEPDIYLGIGSGTHAEQTAKVMVKSEEVFLKERPDLVIVVGDINSTLAGAITAVKLHLPLAHIEAGVRSGDKTMPEEINRLLTDIISDYLFTPLPSADENLKKEGIPENKIFMVGNVMVDSLFQIKAVAERSEVLTELELEEHSYALLTLHRAANVDDVEILNRIATAIREIAKEIPVVFPAHPRTLKNIKAFGIYGMFENKQIKFIKPQGYIRFLKLLMSAKFIMTDSGGIEPETTVLGIPCLTLMESTAWQETVSMGTNILAGNSTENIVDNAYKILNGQIKKGSAPPLWDGQAAERIIDILANLL